MFVVKDPGIHQNWENEDYRYAVRLGGYDEEAVLDGDLKALSKLLINNINEVQTNKNN